MKFSHVQQVVIALDYINGLGMQKIAQERSTSITTISSVLSRLGVPRRKRGRPKGSLSGPRIGQSNEKYERVRQLRQEGKSQREIATIIGCTYQRVQQIEARLGLQRLPAVKARVREKRERQALLKRECSERKRAFIERFSAAYQTKTTQELVAEFGPMYYSIASTLRRKHPDLFPFRDPHHYRTDPDWRKKVPERIKLCQKMWANGASIREMAEHFPITHESFAYWFYATRRNNPALFPARENEPPRFDYSRRMTEAAKLYAQGMGIPEIARAIGLKNFKSLHNAIAIERKRGSTAFPLRPHWTRRQHQPA